MQASAETVDGRADIFFATQWTIVLAASETQQDPAASQAALAALCQSYWPPLYTYARRRGYSMHDAQDLTQGFFAYLLEHKTYKQASRSKGKFRAFLLASFKNFLADARDREAALKRGGGREFIPLDEGRAQAAESLFQTHHSLGSDMLQEDKVFERSWADTLVTTALLRVGSAYKAEGKEALFEQLKCFLTGGASPLPSYAELAARLAMAESTLRSHVTRIRARYRETLRGEVRRTVNTDAEVDEELRALLRVLATG